MSAAPRYAMIHCGECDDDGIACVQQHDKLTLPEGWRWVWAFCLWGNGIDWRYICEDDDCLKSYPTAQRVPPTEQLVATARAQVPEHARYPELRAPGAPGESTSSSGPVRAYLDASTGNLPHDEFTAIDGAVGGLPVLTRPYTYGVWVHVSGEAGERAAVANTLPHLARVIEFAHAHGCDWINFDQDADPVEGLPVWEW